MILSEILISIDDGPDDGFYREHFDDLLKDVKAMMKKRLLSSYSVDDRPDPALDAPTKEDIADYKAYHAGEGIHTP